MITVTINTTINSAKQSVLSRPAILAPESAFIKLRPRACTKSFHTPRRDLKRAKREREGDTPREERVLLVVGERT